LQRSSEQRGGERAFGSDPVAGNGCDAVSVRSPPME